MTQLLDASPLESILADIQRALSIRLYYPAIAVTLTIPEICSALALDRTVMMKEKHYAAFVDKYTTPATLGMGGIDCYRLRGGVIHRGNAAGHPKSGWTHVIFTPTTATVRMHAFSMARPPHSAAMIDIAAFCETMIAGARRWITDHQSNAKVIANMPNLLSLRPHGIFPFINGSVVVASGS